MTEARQRRRWSRWGPVAAVGVALVAALVVSQLGDDGSDGSDRPDLAPVAVSSDAPRRTSLEELVAASDLVVRGQVVSTDRGRVFGDPGSDAAIESRVVTLSVTRVLKGTGATPEARLLVEEEGWTADGAPLIVDGAAPSQAGDDAIWFLTRVGAEEEQRYVVVSAEGRYIVEADGLHGAAGDDPLVAQLAALGPDALEAAILALH